MRQRRRARVVRNLAVNVIWVVAICGLSLVGVLMIMRVSGTAGS
jgi:hypothetical protein